MVRIRFIDNEKHIMNNVKKQIIEVMSEYTIYSKIRTEFTSKTLDVIEEEAKRIIDKIISTAYTSLVRDYPDNKDAWYHHELISFECINEYNKLIDEDCHFLLMYIAIHYLDIDSSSGDFEIGFEIGPESGPNLLIEKLYQELKLAYYEKYAYEKYMI